ncbi:MAG: CPBP family intramembrane glutamic endopeptidase, partial [Candidatus Hodarchaeales archaeon]
MRLREELDKNIPLSLALVLIFLGLNLACFLLLELVFSVYQFSFSQQDIKLSPVLILLAVIVSNVFIILFLIRFFQIYLEQFSSPILDKNLPIKSIFSAIMVAIAFLLFVQYEIVSWWTQIFGQLVVDILPWPLHRFEPEKYEISYLIFVSLIFVLIQPLWEELIFRRILIGNLLKLGFNKVFAVLLSSVAVSLYMALYLLVEISLNDLLWSILSNLLCGMVLGAIFVFTGRIRYSFTARSITNVFLLLLFLSRIHFEFIPYKEVILAISQFILLLGLLIIFYESLQLILDGLFITKLKDVCKAVQILSWPRQHHLKSYWSVLILLIPMFPLGINVFIDHTVLYTDLLAVIIQNGLSIIILVASSLLIFYSVRADLSQTPDNEIKTLMLSFNWDIRKLFLKEQISFRPILKEQISFRSILKKLISSLRSILRGFLSKIRNILLLFRSILREIRAQIVFIILLLGVISPFYILSVVSLTKVEIIIVFQALVDLSIFIAQNPFFTYQHVVTEIRSNVIFIGNSTETLDQLFLLQQSIGKWNFLPDTYMSGSTDWIHGLLTVGIWFGIIILYAFLIKKRKNLSLKVALGAISLIVMNFLWILLALGL